VSDYKWVTFTDNLSLAMASDIRRTIKSDEKVSLRKATDPRAPGKGVEIVRQLPNGGVSIEFVGMERITSVIYSDVAAVVVPTEGGGQGAVPNSKEVK